MEYVVESSSQSLDVELCSLDPADPTHPIDVRYTDRDVILVRKGLATSGAHGATYATYVSFPIPGTPVSVADRRSWNYVAVEKGGQWYNVFETHLEVQEIPTPPGVPSYIFQLAQAGELAGGYVPVILDTWKLPTVLVGDFNTQAEQPPGSPLRATYDYLTGAFPFPDLGIADLASLVGTESPFTDAWPLVNTSPGLTWGFSSDLLSGTPSQRIDFAMFWNATPVSMSTFGGDDLTATNPPRHSSDHLGIVVKISP
jgi:endonuclease/exonuclease/phosphatase family metal-dependent hydrolase